MRPCRFARAFPQHATRSRSFTLAELLIVVLVVGILAAAGLPAISGVLTGMKLRGSAQKLAAGLNYVRSLAITQGAPHGFEFTQTGYRVFKISDAAAAGPIDLSTIGEEDREPVPHPLTRRPWQVDLSDEGIALSADFSEATEMYFDATGAPNPAGTVILQTGGLAITVTVEASTGRVTAAE